MKINKKKELTDEIEEKPLPPRDKEIKETDDEKKSE